MSPSHRRKRSHRLRIETLEEREVPATLTVQQVAELKAATTPVTSLLTAPALPGLDSLDPMIANAVRQSWRLPVGTTTDEWMIQLPAGQSVDLLQPLGAISARPVPYWENAWSVTFAAAEDVAAFPARLWNITQAPFYYPLVERMLEKRYTPNDARFNEQWHLNNTGQGGGSAGEDANVLDAWNEFDGQGNFILGTDVVIGIVDDGLQHAHPDIAPAYSSAHSFDFNGGDPDPTPQNGDAHGTAAGGVAGARGNTIGVSGSAPNATLAGLRLLGAAFDDTDEAASLSYHSGDIDIYSNSWGPADNGTLGFIGPQALAAITQSATTGRGGLGNIYTWAAGNGLGSDDNVNYDSYANSRHVIAVGAVTNSGTQSGYSEPGAAMLVTAYSNGGSLGITTTDLTGAAGYANGDYTTSFGGTSSATPLVSGVVALMLDANPNLTNRDVQHILVRTARQIDPGDADWTTNDAGYPINHKYGFGVIDAHAAVQLAKTWTNVPDVVSATSGVIPGGGSIPDASPTGATATFNLAENQKIEHVEITLNTSDHTYLGDLRVVLTSPSGTQSVLAESRFVGGTSYSGWTFSSVRHWGETSAGTWTLQVIDELADDTGTFIDWSLTVYGTELGVAPALSNIETTNIDYVVGQAPLVVSPNITVTDGDSTLLSGATISIGNYTPGQDILRFTNQNGIGGNFFSGAMTLTGTATVADYQAALRSIRYENLSMSPPLTTREITFVIRDEILLSSNGVSRTVNITALNHEPTLDAIPDPAAINEDAGVQTVNLTGITAGLGDTQDLVVTATSSNPSVIPDPLVLYTSANPTGTLRFTPVDDAFGSATITVTVKDTGGTLNGGDDEITRTFTITVNGSNDAPIFTPGGDLLVNIDTGPTIEPWATAISAGPPDESGQQVTFVVENDNNALFSVQPSIDENGVLSFTPAPNAAGIANVTVHAVDDGGTAFGGVDVSPSVSFLINVEVNDAPSITDAPAGLAPISRLNLDPAGDLVADVVGTSISDPDPTPAQGIAVVGVTRTSDGAWEYSTDGGATWLDLEAASAGQARLLRGQDMVRFAPTLGFIGTPKLQFHAWDQTTGSFGGTADLTPVGATGNRTAFSTLSTEGGVRVAMAMKPTLEDTVKNKGEKPSALLDKGIRTTDADPKAKSGLAITSLNGTAFGTWQYSTNGGKKWTPFGDVSNADALLLRDKDKVRFLPFTNLSGEAFFEYHAWDQTSGKTGTRVDLTTTGVGGGTAFSQASDYLFARVDPVNDRPILDKGYQPALPPVPPGESDPAGSSVANFLRTGVVDGDAGALRGMAIVGFEKDGGVWEYKRVGDPAWTAITAASTRAAILLRADDFFRFRPTSPTTAGSTIKFKAWDQTAGSTASPADTRKDSAFSATIQVGTVAVSPATPPTNNAPVLPTYVPKTRPVLEDGVGLGDPAANLIRNAMTDPDAFAKRGIAVVGLSNATDGKWEFSVDGGRKFIAVKDLSESNALLLRDIDYLRFTPNPDFNGTAGATIRGWDQTFGSGGNLADLTIAGAIGGSGPFSANSVVSTVTVAPRNDAPSLDADADPLFPLQGVGDLDPDGATVETLAAASFADIDAGTLPGIAVTAFVAGDGQWQYKLNGEPGWTDITFGSVSDRTALLLRGQDSIRFIAGPSFAGAKSITYRAWDQSVGAAGGRLDTVGVDAFSKETNTATQVIGDTNNRPMLDPTEVKPLTGVQAGDADPLGNTVATILGGSVTDLDLADLTGLAVVAAKSSLGSWQYSLDNGATWDAVGTATTSQALLLRAQDKLRFVPFAGKLGTAKLSFHAWDQTEGTAGGRANVKDKTLSTFSVVKATTTVAVNNAPVVVL